MELVEKWESLLLATAEAVWMVLVVVGVHQDDAAGQRVAMARFWIVFHPWFERMRWK